MEKQVKSNIVNKSEPGLHFDEATEGFIGVYKGKKGLGVK